MPMEAVIKAQSLGRNYGSVTAVSNISFEVRKGSMLGIVGPDAAGKTTLLQMLAAILDPSSGACRVLGFDTRRHAKRISRDIGYMSQGFTLYDRLTVDENLSFAASIRGVESAQYLDRRRSLLEMAGLEGVTGRAAGQLSGGMRKKLSLMTNLIHEPSLLILDEPGLGVDPRSRRQLWDMLKAFQQRGITTVVATSYMDEAERCDRVMILRDGRSIAVDTPQTLRESVSGHAYEAFSGSPAAVSGELEADANVRGVQWLPDRIRFLLGEPRQAKTVLSTPAVPVEIRPSAPLLEDLLILHGDRETGKSGPFPPLRPGAAHAGQGISVNAASVRFGMFYAVEALDLKVPAGTLLALLGPNGSGKTTLIRALCGLLPLAEGAAKVADIPVSAGVRELRSRIGYMSQKYSLYRDLTPLENLVFYANAYGLGGEAMRETMQRVSVLVGLDNLPEVPSGDLSGAVRQRLALACSLLHRPAVLFLDEPTSGVDPLSRYRFWRIIRSLADGGMTIMVTTHYLNEAEYCDRIGLMMNGKLIAYDTGTALRESFDLSGGAGMEEVFMAALKRANTEMQA